MLQFIVVNLIFIALGVILYLVVRTLPRLGDEHAHPQPVTIFERLIVSEIPERIDAALNAFLGKTLRKTRVVLMRLDNFVSKWLARIKTKNGNGS